MAEGTRLRSKSEKSNTSATEVQSISLNLVKEMLSVQESALKSFFTAYMESTNVRVDSLIKEVRDLKTSIEFTQAQVQELREQNCKEKLRNIQNELENLTDKADDLENRSRRNNLCFEGIPEESENRKETWAEAEMKVMKIMEEQLQLPVRDIKVERAHRVGVRKTTKPRAIVVKFLNYKDRERVMKSRRNLKGSRIFIREGFSDRIAERRKQLIPEMKEARRDGKIAYIRHNKLIIHERPTRAFSFGYGREWQHFEEAGNLNLEGKDQANHASRDS